MGRSSNRKKNKKIADESVVQISETEEQKITKSWLTKTWDSISPLWKILGGLFLLVSGILTCIEFYEKIFPPKVVKDKVETQKDRFKRENIDTGFLKGPIIFKDYIPESFTPIITKEVTEFPLIKGILIKDFAKRGVKLRIGSNDLNYEISQFYNGFSIDSRNYSFCKGFNIFFGVKDDRLYVSVKFKDFYTEQPIGFIEFNKWRLYLSNLLDYDYDDQRLEVRDKSGFVVFSLKYEEAYNEQTPIVNVSGYFISDKSIVILNNDTREQSCVDKRSNPNWKEAALKSIENIKSIF